MTTPPRPDQEQSPPAQVISPGGSAGIFRGRLIIVNGVVAPPGAGIFIYDDTGALVGSWTGAAGTDPLDGESVAEGFTSQNPAGSNHTIIDSGNILVEKVAGGFTPPRITVVDDTLNAGATGTLIESVQVVTSQVATYDPVALDGTIEDWHSLGTLAGYAIDVARYKLSAENQLLIQVQVTSAGANAGSTTFANALPSVYIPASTPAGGLRLPLAQTRAITAADTFPRLFIAQSGAVQIVQTAAVSNTLGTSLAVPLD